MNNINSRQFWVQAIVQVVEYFKMTEYLYQL